MGEFNFIGRFIFIIILKIIVTVYCTFKCVRKPTFLNSVGILYQTKDEEFFPILKLKYEN